MYFETSSNPDRSVWIANGTRSEITAHIHRRVSSLTQRGWRLLSQKREPTEAGTAATLRYSTTVKLRPPHGYEHCGEPTILIRPCLGSVLCEWCAHKIRTQPTPQR